MKGIVGHTALILLSVILMWFIAGGLRFSDAPGFDIYINFKKEVHEGAGPIEVSRDKASTLITYIENRKSNREFRLSVLLLLISVITAGQSAFKLHGSVINHLKSTPQSRPAEINNKHKGEL